MSRIRGKWLYFKSQFINANQKNRIEKKLTQQNNGWKIFYFWIFGRAKSLFVFLFHVCCEILYFSVEFWSLAISFWRSHIYVNSTRSKCCQTISLNGVHSNLEIISKQIDMSMWIRNRLWYGRINRLGKTWKLEFILSNFEIRKTEKHYSSFGEGKFS